MPTFEHDGCTNYYETDGAGRPLLLLHGLAADNASWFTVRRRLAEKFLLIMPDNRFSGRSKAAASAASARTLADDAAALLEHLGIKSAVVCGHSMGGYVAQDFALAHADKTDALILEDTAAKSSARNNALFAALALLLAQCGYSEAFWQMFFPWLLAFDMYEKNPAGVDVSVRAAQGYPYLPTPENFARQAELIAAFDSSMRLAAVKAPCLVLSGAQDVLITPPETIRLAEKIPGARFESIAGVGHVPHGEAPDLFAAAVENFIAALPAHSA